MNHKTFPKTVKWATGQMGKIDHSFVRDLNEAVETDENVQKRRNSVFKVNLSCVKVYHKVPTTIYLIINLRIPVVASDLDC